MLNSTEVLAGNFSRSRGFSSSHNGIDLMSPTGTVVKARFSGTVRVCGTNPPGQDFGNYIRIFYPSLNISGWYAHLQSFTVGVGQPINQGDPIAISDKTGYVIAIPPGDGSHLHYGESTGESLNWVDPDTTKGGDSDMNTPETNEILYKTVLGRSQGTAGDAGVGANLNKPLDEVIKFMWNTQEAKDFQTWLSMVRDQFPKLQATVGQLQTSLTQQTAEIDSLDQKITGQGKIIDEQEQKITDLQTELVSCTTKPVNTPPAASGGLPAINIDPKDTPIVRVIKIILNWIRS